MINDHKDVNSHYRECGGGTKASLSEVQQIFTASKPNEDLTLNLMEQICERSNLNRAYKRVKSNKGSCGVDGMSTLELFAWLSQNKEELIQSLLDGSYTPQPVLEVEIPKPGTKDETRKLGIPSVVDRLVQQAIHQVLEPIFDPGFSESSFGFRPGRSAHNAVQKASSYVQEGRVWVVDIDLEKFFDRVNHDILMSRLARKIKDKRLLKIIRRFLQSGIMRNGVCIERHEGTPQGGPLSPLLSNILLDELDKELEIRGHKFCRYADDHNIYVHSYKAGKRVYESIKSFLEKRLKLRINERKSTVSLSPRVKFLGFNIQLDGRIFISSEAIHRAQEKIRRLTWRSRGKSFSEVISQLNIFLMGWLNYYRITSGRSKWRNLDSWIRRKLRCYKLKQKKKGSTIAQYLISLGVAEKEARQIGSSGKGWWRLSCTRAVHRALTKAWFKMQGLISLEERWAIVVKV